MLSEEIKVFITQTYTNELSDTMLRAFELLDMFEVNGYETNFINAITQESLVTNDQIKDEYDKLINIALDQVLKQHTIELTVSTTLYEKIDIVNGLYILQAMDDYTDVVYILESDMSKEEQLSNILSHLTNLSEPTIFALIEYVSPDLLKQLLDNIYKKDIAAGINSGYFDSVFKTDLSKLLSFIKMSPSKPSLGAMLVKNSVLVGQPFLSYLGFIKEFIDTQSVDVAAYHLFSVMLITSDGVVSPIIKFKEVSNIMYTDITLITQLTDALVKVSMSFDKYCLETIKVPNEKE